LYEEDKKKHNGKASISRTFLKYIKTRIIVACFVMHIYAAALILGPVSIVIFENENKQ